MTLELSKSDLERIVYVYYEDGAPRFIDLRDVPNPYRTECYHDHYGCNMPEKWRLWAWDWRVWLSARFSGAYRARHSKDYRRRRL